LFYNALRFGMKYVDPGENHYDRNYQDRVVPASPASKTWDSRSSGRTPRWSFLGIRGLVRTGDELDAAEAFRFMKANQAMHSVRAMCRALAVSPSGFDAAMNRPPSTRAVADAELSSRIRVIHDESRGTCGMPWVHAELTAGGVRIGRKRVARLMRLENLEGVSRRRKTFTTVRDRDARPAPDLVERDFTATAPDQLWVADIICVPTWAGFLYLAVVLDVWSRRVVGWAMATHLRTELVLEALDIAVEQRRQRTSSTTPTRGASTRPSRSAAGPGQRITNSQPWVPQIGVPSSSRAGKNSN
jgi:hypothetical protein